MTVPFNDLVRGEHQEQEEVATAVQRVLHRGWFVHGPEHARFEQAFASFLGVEECVGVASGTDALTLAIRALTGGVRTGRIVTAANAGGYATTAIWLNGLTPAYADVASDTLCLSAESISNVWDDDVVAVVVTHLYGRMAPVDDIVALCHSRGVPVIEDCAQSVGAYRNGRAAGSIGDVGTFSFYPTKNLGAVGDGGAIVTSDAALGATVRRLRQYGWDGKYRTTIPGGTNSRLDEIQAAVLNVRLPSVADGNARRRQIINRYAEAAGDVEALRIPPADDESHAGHLAVALAHDRDAVRSRLAAKGVATDVHYPVPDHRQPVASSAPPSLPVTEHACEHVVSLPCFPQLDDGEVDHVCTVIRSL